MSQLKHSNAPAVWSFGSDQPEVTGNSRATQVERQHALREAQARMLVDKFDFKWVKSNCEVNDGDPGDPSMIRKLPDQNLDGDRFKAVRTAFLQIARLTRIRFRTHVCNLNGSTVPVVLQEWQELPDGALVEYDQAAKEWRWEAQFPFPLRGLINESGEQVICSKSREGRWKPFQLAGDRKPQGARHV